MAYGLKFVCRQCFSTFARAACKQSLLKHDWSTEPTQKASSTKRAYQLFTYQLHISKEFFIKISPQSTKSHSMIQYKCTNNSQLDISLSI